MRTEFITLINQLKQFDQRKPLDYIISLFNNSEHLFSSPPTDEDLMAYWSGLNQLRTETIRLKNKKDTLLGHSSISQIHQSQQSLNTQIDHLGDRRKELESQTKDLVSALIADLNAVRNAMTSAACEYSTDTLALDIKISLIKEYYEKLSEQIQQVSYLSDQLQIASKLLESDHILQTIKAEVGLDLSFNRPQLEALIKQYSEDHQALAHKILTFTKAQQDLNENISISNSEQIIAQLNATLGEALAKVNEAQTLMENTSLNEDERNDLIERYNQRNTAFDDAKKQADWTRSKLNPKAWFDWGFYNHQYQTVTQLQEKQCEFINALHQVFEGNRIIEDIRKNIINEEATLNNPPKVSKLSLDEAREQSIALLYEEEPLIEWSKVHFTELLRGLIFYTSEIEKKREHIATLCSRFNSLLTIESEIDDLRCTANIMISNEELRVNPIEYESLKLEINQLPVLLDKKRACSDLLLRLDELKSIETEIAALKKERLLSRKSLDRNIKAIVEKNPGLGLSETENDIKSLLNQIKHLPALKLLSPRERCQRYQEEIFMLNDWITNSQTFNRLSIQLQDWYKSLFNNPEIQNSVDMQSLKVIQLLRDIQFELSFGDSQLLEHYQQIGNLDALLNLKPAVPVTLLEQKQLPQPIQVQLDRLYEKAQALSTQYPKQAALLRQATEHLNQVAMMEDPLEKSQAIASVEHQIDDPRYESLRSHRGFFKAVQWIAELCTSILRFFMGTNAGNYRDRFFFRPTVSEQLYLVAQREILQPIQDEAQLYAVFG